MLETSFDNNVKILRGPDHLKIYIFETGQPDDPYDPRFDEDAKNIELKLSEWDSYRLAMTLLKAIGFEVGENEEHDRIQVKYRILHNQMEVNFDH